MTRDGIDAKCDFIRDNIERLGEIPQASFEEFSGDFRNVDSAMHRLQTTIGALIDIGSFTVAALGLPTPERSRSILESLEAAGHLPEGSTTKFGSMFAFRNRVVHLYDRVEARIVYEILTRNRDDLEELLRHLLAALDATASKA
jgi:uncharacterized protein YutE (UPF0331/DUF86 family)